MCLDEKVYCGVDGKGEWDLMKIIVRLWQGLMGLLIAIFTYLKAFGQTRTKTIW